jgi:hypothetical protein
LADHVKENEASEACGTYGKSRNSYRILIGKPEGRKLGRSRRRWKNNIKILKEIKYYGVEKDASDSE